ncbi:MAG: hypothetical protein GEV28_10940 [Actinophytocola sp.]|uniref:DUF5677 domain-containing protein n=1 Tax=Actinophytocola sp. TaxID=1872138 RepID=UPI00132847A6|nr:DUF5677 domain-containing protein [Actinophytocola sp.]MPZ80876.1 hypothetical protein [Actinophytocola sp.]
MIQDENRDPATGQRAGDAILLLTSSFVQLTEAGQISVLDDREHVFQSVYGWWVWINRSSQLVLLAHDAGRGHEAAPSVRSILEHALVLHWVVEVGDDAMAAVKAAGTENRRKLFDHAHKANWPIPPDITRPEKATHPLSGMITNFADLCIAYDAETLYVPYRTLSAHVHPSPKGAEAYLGDDGTLINHGTRPIHDHLVLTAISLIMAARAINSLLAGHPLVEAITHAQDQLGTTIESPRLRRASDR